MDFETRAVHVGSEPDPATGAVIPPIYQTSTFAKDQVGEHKGYEYARTGNPTRASLEACLGSLEGVGADGPGAGTPPAVRETLREAATGTRDSMRRMARPRGQIARRDAATPHGRCEQSKLWKHLPGRVAEAHAP